ncbi:hypothetical protein LR48_Vigan07g034200 [Vigna angularis]|uniref:Uncharacterized protein n=1 Tax=Phaseolus angularis TaxID=3914 RepID=A0A0L9UV53_PHAAN|nr:hypothetical protein LR48_Vigan07g034200 [Vigna angularis]
MTSNVMSLCVVSTPQKQSIVVVAHMSRIKLVLEFYTYNESSVSYLVIRSKHPINLQSPCLSGSFY